MKVQHGEVKCPASCPRLPLLSYLQKVFQILNLACISLRHAHWHRLTSRSSHARPWCSRLSELVQLLKRSSYCCTKWFAEFVANLSNLDFHSCNMRLRCASEPQSQSTDEFQRVFQTWLIPEIVGSLIWRLSLTVDACALFPTSSIKKPFWFLFHILLLSYEEKKKKTYRKMMANINLWRERRGASCSRKRGWDGII